MSPQPSPIASLPMYDLPEARAATDAWWAAIARALARHGIDPLPDELTRGGPVNASWRAPELLLTQTCGYPLRFDFADALTALAVPTYATEGCGPGSYRSAIVVRVGDPARQLADLRNRRAAANSPDSQSGCSALRHTIAPLAERGRFFSEILWSGSHRASLQAVVSGAADVAALDAVTFGLLRRHAPSETDPVRVLAWSAEAPALPYATRLTLAAPERSRAVAALLDAAADPEAADARRELLLDRLDPIDDAAYDPVVEMRRQAEALGYPALA